MGSIVVMALVVAVLVWLIIPGPSRAPTVGDEIDPIDEEELGAAEDEVRDLDVNQRPEDGFEGDDWGPGVAKQ
jgi:hypothetical protein